jgi:uncharacterized protein (DUF1697 family)
MVYVALLRGINVGGHTAVSMSVLKEGFESLGYTRVATYINSGNVIFTCPKTDPLELEAAIESMITNKFGHTVLVVVRNIQEINYIINNVPTDWFTTKTKKCNVIFLHHSIDSPDVIAGAKPKQEIEECEYLPGVILWAAQTSDLTKSAMVKLSKSPHYKSMTVRNLATTLKIQELMQRV